MHPPPKTKELSYECCGAPSCVLLLKPLFDATSRSNCGFVPRITMQLAAVAAVQVFADFF